MAEKSDEEIINEVGLESSSSDEEGTLEPIATEEENSKDNVIENEDRDDEKELANDSKNSEENEESLPVQKKQPKMYKILIGVAAFLLVILIIGAIMYFTGFFDPEPVKTPEKKIEKKIEPEITFEEKNINKAQLNKKLKMLTKREIMNKEELEAEEKRIKEEERKKKEAEQKALEEKQKKEAERLAKIEEEKRLLAEQQEALKKEQEELLMLQENLKAQFEEEKKRFLEDIENQKAQIEVPVEKEEPVMNEEPMPEEPVEVEEEPMVEEKNVNQFLAFINVATVKGNLYKSFLDEVLKIDKNVSLCRDFKNRIEIYSGPFDSEIQRQKVLNNLLEKGIKEAYLVDFTQEEYEKRCKY